MRAIALEAVGVTKRFGGVPALDDVSLRIAAGSVHALLGENGAGKSTFARCLLGAHRAYSGRFLIDGRAAAIRRPTDADRLGIGMAQQRASLAPSLTVAENFLVSRRDLGAVIEWRGERIALDRFLQAMPFRVSLETPVDRLGAGERQEAEVLRQRYLRRRLLVLDEPTALLTPAEAAGLLGTLRDLARAGETTICLITHRLDEVGRYADAVTVLRRGRVAGTVSPRLGAPALASLMLGAGPSPARADHVGAPAPATALRIEDLRLGDETGATALHIERLELRGREIVGILGQGARLLGEWLGGQRVAISGRLVPSDRGAIRMLVEEPMRLACVPGMTLGETLDLREHDRHPRRFWRSRAAARARAARLIAAFDIRPPRPDAPIETLSGGNLQRAILARELDGPPGVLVAVNPCAGLDVAAAAMLDAALIGARRDGWAVLLIDDDPDRLRRLSDRFVALAQAGPISGGAGQDRRRV